MSSVDRLFQEKKIDPFAFNEDVAHVFENMLNRSIPGYNLILSLSLIFAKKYIQTIQRFTI